MFDIETEKLAIIEKVIKTDDESLLLVVKNLLNESAILEYSKKLQPMEYEEFYRSIKESEKAIEAGKTKNHAEVGQIIESWKRK
jgi:hypothetical protein